ncbi:TetR/AcrR family transcriptional regulator [Treponema sp. Marseille-Q3903]|uniref:TetR/AcrR family transcriptional regulator n=1 Tax=Treponema sp. Marseille-Q3903 TaxID=2766703 RepID=UPI001652A1CF|nr:TetR/AcrR family transcriptional regulator [Treponema sp. Marseille-Q3903]MBC6712705.1 TetR/AcrR family transcriptional regulator [Treponema sp. Marseille-Q3903]
MAIVVEHDKRKHEILQKSLDVFIDEGYEDATFQKIADRCGITRTTLYIYFKNKHEIFLGSIKALLSDLEIKLKSIMKDETLSAEVLLRKVLRLLAASCEENKKLYNVLLNYLMQLKKSGIDTNERVRRRTIRLRHLMSTILIKGIQNKEFKDLNVKDLNEILYGLLEAGMFRIAVLNQNNISEIDNALNTVVDSIKM